MLYFVEGEPATFATNAEKIWKEKLSSKIPPCLVSDNFTGVQLRFKISSLLRNGHSFDLDNLVEPVFFVLIGKKGYFSGERKNIKWWYAKKEKGSIAGVEIQLLQSNPKIKLEGKAIFEGIYNGVLPKSAKSEELPEWLISQGFNMRKYDRFGVHLIFPEKINIGEISTGAVKSTLDCLWPIIGGSPCKPEDWRIEELLVEKTESDITKIKILKK